MEMFEQHIELSALIERVSTEWNKITVEEQQLFSNISTLEDSPEILVFEYTFNGQEYTVTVNLDDVIDDSADIFEAQAKVREIVTRHLQETGVFQQPSDFDPDSLKWT